MSLARFSHCACPTPEVTNIPGAPGLNGGAGHDGNNGSDGINPFTLVAGAGFSKPPKDGTTPVTIPVLTSVWAVVGENIYIQGGGVFTITGIPSTSSFTAVFPKYSVNVDDGAPVVAGNAVSPTGYQVFITGISALTDSTGGTPSATLAAGVGRETVAFYMTAKDIATGDVLTTYVPGYAFKILKFDARCALPITTGGAASNVSLKINAAAVTGGVVALAGTYIQGAAQAGTAIIGANVGTLTDSISIVATTSVAFSEGAIWLLLEIQNIDTANALSSLASTINAMRTQLV